MSNTMSNSAIKSAIRYAEDRARSQRDSAASGQPILHDISITRGRLSSKHKITWTTGWIAGTSALKNTRHSVDSPIEPSAQQPICIAICRAAPRHGTENPEPHHAELQNPELRNPEPGTPNPEPGTRTLNGTLNPAPRTQNSTPHPAPRTLNPSCYLPATRSTASMTRKIFPPRIFSTSWSL
jgi:hypothetical protein